MLEAIVELLVEFLGELLIQTGLEVLAELGLRSVQEVARGRRASPLLALIGHAILGAAAGGLSLIFFPHSAITTDALRMTNLIVGPIAAGALMAGIGVLLRRRDRPTIRIESFGYGFTFAFSLNLVRYFFAT